jgi:uncharacterized protein
MLDPKAPEPVVVDSLEFARAGKRLCGDVALSQLDRLADSLLVTQGRLQFEIVGGYDARQRPVLKVSIDGELVLRCQRCLGPLPHRLATASQLLVLSAGSAGVVEDLDDLDGVPAASNINVATLVEDEVLLALPMAPRHAEGACAVAADGGKAAASPFAALQKLKSK